MKKLLALFISFLAVSNTEAQISLKHTQAITVATGKGLLMRQPDGKLLYFTATEGSFYSGRLFANGENDDAYNGARTSKQKLNHLYRCCTQFVTTDKWDRILIAGTAAADSAGVVMSTLVRYTRNGDPDPDFTPVIQQFRVRDTSELGGVFLLNDEKIMTVGSSCKEGVWQLFLSRLQYNGESDTTFSASGVFIDNSIPGSSRVGGAIKQTDGKIIVVAGNENGAERSVVVCRYYPDGTKDTAFGIGGSTLIVPGSKGYLLPKKVQLQSDGKIIIAGICTGENGGNNIFLLRLTQWGVADTSFSGKPMVLSKPCHESRVDDLLLLADDKIILSGAGNAVGEQRFGRELLLRFAANGTADATYGYGNNIGVGNLLVNKAFTTAAYNIALAANEGKIYRFSEMISGYETILSLTTFLLDTSLGVIDVPNRKVQSNIYPVPVHNRISFSFDLIDDQTVSTRLLDLSGKVVSVISENVAMTEGENTVTIPFPATARPGRYFAEITTSQGYKQLIEVTKL